MFVWVVEPTSSRVRSSSETIIHYLLLSAHHALVVVTSAIVKTLVTIRRRTKALDTVGVMINHSRFLGFIDCSTHELLVSLIFLGTGVQVLNVGSVLPHFRLS